MITDRTTLAFEIKKRMIATGPVLVSIDGVDGSGKTMVADYMVEQIGCGVIHLDEHIDENRGAYVGFIHSDELKSAILEAKKTSRCVFVEGVCVLQVLENIGLQPDCKIYVKKLKWGQYWIDGNIYDGAMTLEEKLSLEERGIREFADLEGDPLQEGDIALSGLMRDVITYHWTYRPDENADIVFGNQTD